MFKIKQFDHTADVGFKVEADELSELFKGAAIATFDVMVDLNNVEEKITKKIKLKNKSYDKLLYDFIDELIFLKDAEYSLFSKFKVKISKSKDSYSLEAEIKGEKINPKKHELKIDVKAITLYEFYVKKVKNKWEANIILDI